MLAFQYDGVNGYMVEAATLTSGMTGATVKFIFSDDWENLRKTAVFVAGPTTKDVVDVGEEVVIPHEVLQHYGDRLYVGIYGVSESGTVTPTVYAKGPKIVQGADPSGDITTDPALPVWAELKLAVEALKKSGIGKKGVHIGPEPPEDTSMIWVDTSDNTADGPDQDLDENDIDTAIENALEKAKESGAFDGKDGKDGVIALTGAKVGDIARVAAVDENGVPTAWEPVDMPSGEKEWKHIRTIVLEEDVQYVSVTTDEDGNPFEFDEIVIRSVTMEGDDGKNVKTGAMWVNDIGLDVHSASTALYFGFYARHNPGYFSPVVVYLHPFCDCFALHCWYHDNGVSTDAFLAGKYAAYNDAIKNTSLCAGTKQPTNMFDYGAVNGQNLVHGVKVATKITAFSYGAPFADHLMAKGSIFEFYGR